MDTTEFDLTESDSQEYDLNNLPVLTVDEVTLCRIRMIDGVKVFEWDRKYLDSDPHSDVEILMEELKYMVELLTESTLKDLQKIFGEIDLYRFTWDLCEHHPKMKDGSEFLTLSLPHSSCGFYACELLCACPSRIVTRHQESDP